MLARLLETIADIWRVIVRGELSLLDRSAEKFDFGDNARKSREEKP